MSWNLDEALKKERQNANEFLGLDGTAILDANAPRHTAVALTDIARTLREIRDVVCNPLIVSGHVDPGDVFDTGLGSPEAQAEIQRAAQEAVSEVNEALGHADTRA